MDDFETIETRYGKIRANKKFFTACSYTGVAFMAASVGLFGAKIFTGYGSYITPLVTSGLGAAAALVPQIFIEQEDKDKKRIDNIVVDRQARQKVRR